MATNIVEGILSPTGLILDLGTVSQNSGASGSPYTVGNAFVDLATQNVNNPDYLVEYISFQLQTPLNETRFTSLGTIGGQDTVWRMRLESDSFGGATFARVSLDPESASEPAFDHFIATGYELFAVSDIVSPHTYIFPDPTDPDNSTLTNFKAAGLQDALVATPNTISSIDTYIVYGSGFSDQITGTANRDRLLGRAGDDLLVGGAGRDFLNGSGGNDSLKGGTGADRFIGGAGADTMIFDSADIADAPANRSIDTLVDFDSAEGDVIELRDGISVFTFANGFSAGIGDVVFTNDFSGNSSALNVRTDTTGTNSDFTRFAEVSSTLTLDDFVLA